MLQRISLILSYSHFSFDFLPVAICHFNAELCHPSAVCHLNSCKCKPGYVGDGISKCVFSRKLYEKEMKKQSIVQNRLDIVETDVFEVYVMLKFQTPAWKSFQCSRNLYFRLVGSNAAVSFNKTAQVLIA